MHGQIAQIAVAVAKVEALASGRFAQARKLIHQRRGGRFGTRESRQTRRPRRPQVRRGDVEILKFGWLSDRPTGPADTGGYASAHTDLDIASVDGQARELRQMFTGPMAGLVVKCPESPGYFERVEWSLPAI